MLHDVVAKSGAFFSYNDDRLGQGRANARTFLKANPDMAAAIETEIRRRAGLPLAPGAAAAGGGAVAVDAVTGEVL